MTHRKIYTYLSISLTAVLMLFAACTKTDDSGDDNNGTDNKPKETLLVSHKMITPIETVEIDIAYNQDLLPEKITEKSSGTVVKVSVYTYNGSALNECKYYSDEAMTNQLGTVSYQYNGSGQLTTAVEINGADTTRYSLSYSGNHLTEVMMEHPTVHMNDSKISYEWQGDNISKKTLYQRDSAGVLTANGYTAYTNYDTKLNPISLKMIPLFDQPVFLSKNNQLEYKIYDAYGILQSLGTYTYIYNSKDLPESGTFDFGYISGQIQFTYEDLSKP